MVGILKMWSVSGLTTEGSKISEPMNALGSCLAEPELFEDLEPSNKITLISIGKQFLVMKTSFDIYFRTRNKSYHDDAVKFLVMVAAVMQGADGEDWSWQRVRHFAQGLYGSLMDEPHNFRQLNIPIIEKISDAIEWMIEGAVS